MKKKSKVAAFFKFCIIPFERKKNETFLHVLILGILFSNLFYFIFWFLIRGVLFSCITEQYGIVLIMSALLALLSHLQWKY